MFYTFEINLNDKGGGLAKYSNRAPSSRGPEQQLALRLLLLLLLLDPPPVLLLLLLVAPGVTLFLFSVAAVVAVGFLVRRVLPAPHLELDLLLLQGGRRLGFEFKFSDQPGTTKSMRTALQNLAMEQLDVVHSCEHEFPLWEAITPISLRRMIERFELSQGAART